MAKLLLVESDAIRLREYLKVLLSVGIHTVVFEKKDGTIRNLVGTRDPNCISKELFENFSAKKAQGGVRIESTTSLPIMDTEINQWRSFPFDSLISVDGININTILTQAQVNIEG
ncbi:hypothetical protein Acj9p213 [Acinetobacter phage Acj9]|uniref:Uncharacterized protein 31.1 n=1 Tax=Acinetobacter phage Acj9 TaxID=760939 RepID=E5EPZ7_9CAUD|nr:hypothetical protein Acj9p213 [Acinetobacter phage Acj9]ADG60113.1 conserved hypothetical protein [Acinetobacter phage Acj9]